MNYRSLADLNDTIIRNLHRLPRDIDLVVGVPRSGLLAANLFSLVTNIRLTDLDSFLEGRIYTSGTTKRHSGLERDIADMRRILILDDSIQGGNAMRDARKRVEESGIQDRSEAEILFSAVYGAQSSHPEADFIFEQVDHPCLFQWNFMHHSVLDKNCVVIDGVLCPAQIEQENDGEEAYLQSISEALPLHPTSRRIGYLVSTRPEKYRKLTEAWLERHDIRYGELIMADFPSRDEEQLLAKNSRFKADFYRKSDANLFIENDYEQAQMIARMSGKPVLCVETHHISRPDRLSPVALRQQMRNLPTRLKQRRHEAGRQLKGLARSMLGEASYLTLKKLVRPKPKG